MAARGGPQDGTLWHSPETARQMGGVHENSVLFYFAKSIFFDPTSNNAFVETQASFNPAMADLVSTRQTFEAHLRTMQGLEYVVASSPRDFGPEAPIGKGTWVIHKQNRRKRRGSEDEVSVLATYYVTGITVCMAPSVGDVLFQKTLSTTLALNKLFASASKLSLYTPALGHRYLSPVQQHSHASGALQAPLSKESTPMPMAENQKQTETSSSGPNASQTYSASSAAADNQALYESFDQFLRYNHEYMDENPLVGEPGSFVFSSSKQSIQQQAAQRAQHQRELELQLQRAGAQQVEDRSNASQMDSQGGASADDKPEAAPAKKGSYSGMPKPKRRKSKAPATPDT